MAIYRGVGGAGEANDDATLNAVTEKATDAATSAAEAESSANAAASSASSASTSATNAASSASSASTSASTATTQATNAATSATASAASASAANTSAGTASDEADYAEEWATKAEDSLISISAGGDGSTDYSSLHHAAKSAASATAAASSASSASTSATTATTKASEASTSATAAASSASAASTSETNAATSATAAAGSATSASSSATSAASAQSAAESARDATLAAYDSFDDRYLGVKSSAPSVDNDGNALVAGALYFDSTANKMQLYTGSTWVDAYTTGSGFLQSSNNLSDLDSASTARTNLGLGTAATTASTDYATAAQGALADSALQNITGQSIENLSDVNTMTPSDGQLLTWDNGNSRWDAADAPVSLPDQTGNAGEYLTTDGSTASWAALDTDANSTTKGLYEHANTISANYSITSGNNAMSVGPISVDSGVSVTIPSGSVWTIV